MPSTLYVELKRPLKTTGPTVEKTCDGYSDSERSTEMNGTCAYLRIRYDFD